MLDEINSYCQNWRADVVATVSANGGQLEQFRYSAYGVPYSIPVADYDLNGSIDSFDSIGFNGNFGGTPPPPYNVRADVDLNGALDFFDVLGFLDSFDNVTVAGRGDLSSFGHRFGYAGYWYVPERGLYHVRNRWYRPENGRWLTRDPKGYVDGSRLMGYGSKQPLRIWDPLGLDDSESGGGRSLWQRIKDFVFGGGSPELAEQMDRGIAEREKLADEMARDGDLGSDAAQERARNLRRYQDEGMGETADAARDVVIEYAALGFLARAKRCAPDVPDRGGGYTPAPRRPDNKIDFPDGFSKAPTRPTGRPRAKNDKGQIVEWDSQEREWEFYDKNGNHLGIMKPGENHVRPSTAKPNRKVPKQ